MVRHRELGAKPCSQCNRALNRLILAIKDELGLPPERKLYDGRGHPKRVELLKSLHSVRRHVLNHHQPHDCLVVDELVDIEAPG
jgi:hypothetical protein